MAAKIESPMFSQPQNEPSIVNIRSAQNDDNLTMDDVRSVADGMQKILAAGQSQRGRRAHDDEDADHNIDHIRNLIDNLDDEVSILLIFQVIAYIRLSCLRYRMTVDCVNNIFKV